VANFGLVAWRELACEADITNSRGGWMADLSLGDRNGPNARDAGHCRVPGDRDAPIWK